MANLKENPVEKRWRIVNELIEEGAGLVEARYGSGHGDGVDPLVYHNSTHTRSVVGAVREIARLAVKGNKISLEEAELLIIAAAFHDVEQSLDSGKNEEESTRISKKYMERKGIFTKGEKSRVGTIIMASVTNNDGSRLVQSPTDDYLTKAMCDGDLADLGRPFSQYWDRTIALFKEIEKRDNFSEGDIRRIASLEIGILENHAYHTEEAEFLFDQKNQNIQRLHRLAEAA